MSVVYTEESKGDFEAIGRGTLWDIEYQHGLSATTDSAADHSHPGIG